MQPLLLAFTAAAGMMAAMQAGSNAALGKAVGQVTAALTSLALSGTCLVLIGLVTGGIAWPGSKAAGVSWWAWTGGFMGAVVLGAQLFAAQQLGSAVFAAVFVTASLVASVILDHYGLLGFQQHPASWLRIGGISLMIAGVFAVSRG